MTKSKKKTVFFYGSPNSSKTIILVVENSQKQNMAEMRNMLSSLGMSKSNSPLQTQSPQSTNPDITVSPPSSLVSSTGFDCAQALHQVQQTGKSSYAATAGKGLESNNEGGSYSNYVPAKQPSRVPIPRARAEQGGQRKQNGKTERSTSSKRRRLSQNEETPGGEMMTYESVPSSNDTWLTQGRDRKKTKNRPKVNTGSANSEGLLDQAGPGYFWIGNTRADTDKDKVEDLLKIAADNLEVQNFKVEEVVCLTKDPHFRTKSWKVAVPSRLCETMLKPEMYPAGWTFRPFTLWHKGSSKRSDGAKSEPAASNEPVGAKSDPTSIAGSECLRV